MIAGVKIKKVKKGVASVIEVFGRRYVLDPNNKKRRKKE
jgi:hypothetical protein